MDTRPSIKLLTQHISDLRRMWFAEHQRNRKLKAQLNNCKYFIQSIQGSQKFRVSGLSQSLSISGCSCVSTLENTFVGGVGNKKGFNLIDKVVYRKIKEIFWVLIDHCRTIRAFEFFHSVGTRAVKVYWTHWKDYVHKKSLVKGANKGANYRYRKRVIRDKKEYFRTILNLEKVISLKICNFLFFAFECLSANFDKFLCLEQGFNQLFTLFINLQKKKALKNSFSSIKSQYNHVKSKYQLKNKGFIIIKNIFRIHKLKIFYLVQKKIENNNKKKQFQIIRIYCKISEKHRKVLENVKRKYFSILNLYKNPQMYKNTRKISINKNYTSTTIANCLLKLKNLALTEQNYRNRTIKSIFFLISSYTPQNQSKKVKELSKILKILINSLTPIKLLHTWKLKTCLKPLKSLKSILISHNLQSKSLAFQYWSTVCGSFQFPSHNKENNLSLLIQDPNSKYRKKSNPLQVLNNKL